mmetsp:Transcript_37246/g.43475  ORF Transcript_37246/g.43475 Transcript_37246/m.43475 type:complete len:140 (-) Transcript_37246:150-569(-)|eukprot:CAMPEP_0176462328 /NCGR_PEP_ID=MMETSP0127-20121128/35194_1 /TAXON_ID=938130 /ORGANISM="Platyophrya macrostoma, Strain WH" /LENGTH=139 /DNA_ID=CAMNT_0017854209 /DNA_START=15 /DNA_END=434 /DNA_ORIENTATION=-
MKSILIAAFVLSLIAIQSNQAHALQPISVFQAAVSSYDTAVVAAHTLLQDKTAATVSILGDKKHPVITMELVDDKIAETNQYLLVIKSRSAFKKKIIWTVQSADNNNRNLELIEFPITDSNYAFHKWILDNTRDKDSEL